MPVNRALVHAEQRRQRLLRADTVAPGEKLLEGRGKRSRFGCPKQRAVERLQHAHRRYSGKGLVRAVREQRVVLDVPEQLGKVAFCRCMLPCLRWVIDRPCGIDQLLHEARLPLRREEIQQRRP